jgi:nucleoside-diphosphate-sugar epimerase
LVTGASGFIGSVAVVLLQAAGFDVHAVALHDARFPAGVTLHRCDLLEPAAVARMCADARASHLLHLAWCTQRADYRDSAENHAWRTAGAHLIETFARAGGTRIVATGTGAEYGPQAGTLGEHLAVAPVDAYATEKASLGAFALEYGSAAGMTVTWARIFQAYGSGEAPNKFVRSVATRLLRGEPVPTTDGAQVRDFIHVRDIAAALVTLLGAQLHGVVNVGTGEGRRVRDVLAAIGDATGRASLLRYGEVARPTDDPAVQVADVTKLTGTGWRPRVPFADGLADEVRWCAELAAARAG